jgi:hypothetical protein
VAVKRWLVQERYTRPDRSLAYTDLSEHWFRWRARQSARILCRLLRPRGGVYMIVVVDRTHEYENERIGVQ